MNGSLRLKKKSLKNGGDTKKGVTSVRLLYVIFYLIDSSLQLRSDRLKKVDPKFVQRNAAFLLDTLLSLVSE